MLISWLYFDKSLWWPIQQYLMHLDFKIWSYCYEVSPEIIFIKSNWFKMEWFFVWGAIENEFRTILKIQKKKNDPYKIQNLFWNLKSSLQFLKVSLFKDFFLSFFCYFEREIFLFVACGTFEHKFELNEFLWIKRQNNKNTKVANKWCHYYYYFFFFFFNSDILMVSVMIYQQNGLFFMMHFKMLPVHISLVFHNVLLSGKLEEQLVPFFSSPN